MITIDSTTGLDKSKIKSKREQLLELQAIRNRWPISAKVKKEIIDSAIEIISDSRGNIVDTRARVNAMKILHEMEQQNIEQEEKLIQNLQDDIEYEEEQEELRLESQNPEHNLEYNNEDTEYDDALSYNKNAANGISSSSEENGNTQPIQVNVQNNIVNPIFPEGLDLEAKKQFLLDKFNQKEVQ